MPADDGPPLPRERLPAGLEDSAAAALVAATEGDPDAARAAFAFAHGMVVLELNDRFPPGADLDAAWKRGVDASARRSPSSSVELPDHSHGPDPVAGNERHAVARGDVIERGNLDRIIEIDRIAVVELGAER